VKKLLALALSGLLFVSAMAPVFAQAPQACAAIDNDGERLACYDAVFRGGDPSADMSVVFTSEQMIPARPSGRDHATITVSCTAGTLNIAFGFAGNTLSALGNDAGITLQFDLQAARSRTLPVNAENTALVINNTADASAFLDMLQGATNLTVRVTPVNSRSLSVRFRLDVIRAEVAPVRDACV